MERLFVILTFELLNFGGGGGTPLKEANRDVPLDGVALSRLE